MHYWGEKDFDWNGLNEAINLIVTDLKKVRIPISQYKEKFGTARIYCRLGWYSLHDIIYPGYCSYQFPKWLIHLDIHYLSKIIRLLCPLILPIHKIVYRNAYKKAVDQYPHLKEEICCIANYVELLDFYKPKEYNGN